MTEPQNVAGEASQGPTAHRPAEARSGGAGRSLPAHIAAQLASAGGTTDTGGQPWEGRNLGEGTSHTHAFPGDDGRTPPVLAEALGRFARAEVSEEVVVAALRSVRLFTPVLAELSQAVVGEDGLVSDKESDMAVVSIAGPDGRKTLPVFSAVDALTSWHPQARPVAADSRKVALAAVEDGHQLLVLDPGGEVPFVVRRPALWALAKDEPWVPSYSDPRVQESLRRCAAAVPAILEAEAVPGRGVASRGADGRLLPGGGHGPELGIRLGLRPGLDQQGLDSAVQEFQAALTADEYLRVAVDSLEIRLRPASSAEGTG